MPHESIISQNQSTSDWSLRDVLLTRMPAILFYIFLSFTAVALFIPLNPKMPSKGIDASWELAMNEAVARHMSFGNQVMFTYGPYASILTRTYSPATDSRMMLGSLLVGLSYVAALLFLERGRKKYITIILLLFLATYGNPELLLLSYAFLLVVCVLKRTNSDVSGKASSLNWRQVVAVIVMLIALGLLPLTKGSLLLPYVAAAVIPSAFLLYRARIRQAFLFLLIPVAATAVFWMFAGQSLANLRVFMHGTTLLASGYTEAMSTPWSIIPAKIGDGLVIISLAVTALIFLSIIRSTRLTVASRWMLALLFAVLQFVAFKHGIVKAESLSSIFSSLTVFVLIIAFLYMDRFLIWALSITIVLTAITAVRGDAVLNREVHERFGANVTWRGEKHADIFKFCLDRAIGAYARTTYKSTWTTYGAVWNGIRSRMSNDNDLQVLYRRAMEGIRDDYPLPALKGTGDVYSYEQSVLLASDNKWNPRPIFQSYSAYTPTLAKLNEQHLRKSDAPDWVLVDLETVQGRLPSLDDGASWPALLDNYTYVSYDGRYILLQKRQVIHGQSHYEGVYREICKTGKTVPLPKTDGLLFAEVELKPTLLGQLLTALFNPPQLHIVLGLGNGRTLRYRVVANMMTTSFLVSPFVRSTSDFASLANGKDSAQKLERVESISIEPAYGGSLFWSGTYALRLKRYVSE
jgi:hypothetical protein